MSNQYVDEQIKMMKIEMEQLAKNISDLQRNQEDLVQTMSNNNVKAESKKEVFSEIGAIIHFDNKFELKINKESASCLEDMNFQNDDYVDVVDIYGITCSINLNKIVLIAFPSYVALRGGE
ncbi:TPA: hypothetical protein ROY11_004474 [Bacillus cereus]|nr:hypothetical protein [Bacillus cereus]